MLILGAAATTLFRITTDAAADIEVHASWGEIDTSVPPVVQQFEDEVLASIVTATTVTILAGATSKKRNVKECTVFNNHASVSCNVVLFVDDGTNIVTLAKANLLAGESLCLSESGTWFHYDVDRCLKPAAAKIDTVVRVANDVTNATTSMADVTGLAVALQSGKRYAFEATLFHQTNATTTGAQFGINIGAAPTALCLSAVQQITSSVTAATYGSSAMVTARDTAAVVETTGPGAANFLAILSGFIQPSADGTLAVRCASEVAVAGGLVVKAGSWLWVKECDN